MYTHSYRSFYSYQKRKTGIYYCVVLSPEGEKLFTVSTGLRNKKEAEALMNEWAVKGFPAPRTYRTCGNSDKKNLSAPEHDLLIKFKTMAIEGKLDFQTWADNFIFLLSQSKDKLSKDKVESLINNIADIYEINLTSEENSEDEKKDPLFIDFAQEFMDYEVSPFIQEKKEAGFLEKKITKKAFTSKYYTIKKYMPWFDEHYPNLKLKDLTAEIVNKFFSYIYDTGNLKLTTLKKEQSHFKCILKFAEKKQLIPIISSDLIKYEAKPTKKEILNKEQVKMLFSSPDNFTSLEEYCLHRLAVESACRVGELQGLMLDDLNVVKNISGKDEYWLRVDKAWNNKENRMSTTKTKNSKTVMLSKELYEYLEKLNKSNPYKDKGNAFIFYHKKNPDRPLHYKYITNDMDKMYIKLGLKKKGLTFHSYRHLAVVILNDNKYSDEQIMLLTGHSSSQMVAHYADHLTEAKKVTYRQMNKQIANFIKNPEKNKKRG